MLSLNPHRGVDRLARRSPFSGLGSGQSLAMTMALRPSTFSPFRALISMEPIPMIMAMLAPAATEGAKKVAQVVAPDLYNALKALIQKRLAGQPAAETVLDEYEKDPQTDDKPLAKILAEAGVEKDEEILAVLEQIKAQTPAAASVTTIGQGAKGIIGQTVIGASITGNIS